ncbi:hypothetical protein RRG08_028868 [Elysia crispata]|uniref:Uncharacterized protein n=1 Tax=Elysia crispata TaxID=231223 RepID=A0AAE0Z0I9_9GAST|nr:hypothetical protein RRG08_028868 [Elysia crispata]
MKETLLLDPRPEFEETLCSVIRGFADGQADKVAEVHTDRRNGIGKVRLWIFALHALATKGSERVGKPFDPIGPESGRYDLHCNYTVSLRSAMTAWLFCYCALGQHLVLNLIVRRRHRDEFDSVTVTYLLSVR